MNGMIAWAARSAIVLSIAVGFTRIAARRPGRFDCVRGVKLLPIALRIAVALREQTQVPFQRRRPTPVS
ncbi:hypothetical protein [Bradyrhizobium sp. SRS-191]|uniref:hypothetical protein n=1 Tax=Bradyrhizobium sp. SRS-191 TaxID=2962606 RepID=UPI00211DD446|nr:hypothetical protein [Bradyrhizobium sp. SRS-191]